MGNNTELPQSLKDINKAINNDSWFRDTPHYWIKASLPFAYATACVEVVYKNSEKARAIYQQIVEAWIAPEIKTFSDKIMSMIPESEKEKIKNALVHPETEILPDPNRPFKQLEEMFTGLELNEDFSKDDDTEQLTPEDEIEAEKFAELVCLIMELVIVGFNRESDIEKGKYRVIPSMEKAPWLVWAVLIKTYLESWNITFENIRNFYKLRKCKGKIIDFQKVLKEQGMSRWHRRMVASSKAVNLKLKNDRIFIEAAHNWYKSRVLYQSINKYCEAFENYKLEPKNIYKQIKPCDDAVGYIKRIHRKEKPA